MITYFQHKLAILPEQKRYQLYSLLSCITSALIAIIAILFQKIGYLSHNTQHTIGEYLFYVTANILFSLFFTFIAYYYPEEPSHQYSNNDKKFMWIFNSFCLTSPFIGYFMFLL